MRKAEIYIGQLSVARAAQKLAINLICHPQARSTNRMAEAFQSAIGLARHRAIVVIAAIQYVEYGAAFS
jgi:hypothetical protein